MRPGQFAGRRRNAYLRSHGNSPAIRKISAGGQASKLTELPPGAWPNKLEIGPDGMLDSPDSAPGTAWRIDPHSGRGERR